MSPVAESHPPRIHPTVKALGMVSFLTDSSSDMIMPYLPAYLNSIGGGALALGVIEGVAEAMVSVWKMISGLWADRITRRKPLVVAGYGLSSVIRPLVGFTQAWPMVLAIRMTDRVGKGLRSSPRDALITDVTDPARRGEAFGYHRSMDHAGAMVGSSMASGLLALGMSMPHMFLATAVPGLMVMLFLVFRVKEPPRHQAIAPALPRNWWSGWSGLSADLKKFLFLVVVFALGNSTDLFLLMGLQAAGLELKWMGLMWALHHAVKMLSNYYGGRISDRIPRKTSMILGWLIYGLAYLGFARSTSLPVLIALFLFYSLYYGLVEPAEKAWVADMAPGHLRGTAFGFFHGITGLAALPASALFGLLWKFYGAPAAFTTGAALAGAAAVGLWMFMPNKVSQVS